jgi:hypothetical protein
MGVFDAFNFVYFVSSMPSGVGVMTKMHGYVETERGSPSLSPHRRPAPFHTTKNQCVTANFLRSSPTRQQDLGAISGLQIFREAHMNEIPQGH